MNSRKGAFAGPFFYGILIKKGWISGGQKTVF